MLFDEFAKLAKERYGDKAVVSGIETDQLALDMWNLSRINDHGRDLTVEDMKNYVQVWPVPGSTCPECGDDLGGMFGTFRWGIVNGEGECSHCGTQFRYLHHIGNAKTFGAYALIGIVEPHDV